MTFRKFVSRSQYCLSSLVIAIGLLVVVGCCIWFMPLGKLYGKTSETTFQIHSNTGQQINSVYFTSGRTSSDIARISERQSITRDPLLKLMEKRDSMFVARLPFVAMINLAGKEIARREHKYILLYVEYLNGETAQQVVRLSRSNSDAPIIVQMP